jgi:Flp pilus assembly protein TadB
MDNEKRKTQAIFCGCIALILVMVALVVSIVATLCAIAGAVFGFGSFALYSEYQYQKRGQ